MAATPRCARTTINFSRTCISRSFGPLDPGAKFDEEGTGWGWKLVGAVKANDTILPTTCKMERP